MKVLGQLKDACLEILGIAPSTNTQGRVWYDSTKNKPMIDSGSQKRAILVNDDKLVVGNSVTASQNIRAHRGDIETLQFVKGSDTTAEGTLSTNLAKVSAKIESFTGMTAPQFGNVGRLGFFTDTQLLMIDNGSAWKPLGSRTAYTQANSNYTATIYDEFIVSEPSSNYIQISLPDPLTCPGKRLKIMRTDTSANNKIVIIRDTFASQNNVQGILGAPAGTTNQVYLYNLPFCRNESVVLIAMGTRWAVDDNQYFGNNAGESVFNFGITANPTSPAANALATQQCDVSRSGKSVQVNWQYKTNAVVTQGSGDYTFSVGSLPFRVDPNLVTSYGTSEGTGGFTFSAPRGSAMASSSSDATKAFVGSVIPFIGTSIPPLSTGEITFRMAGVQVGSAGSQIGYVGSTFFGTNDAGRVYGASFTLPIMEFLG